ncbi:hypothetical protein PL11201_680112 [Planktothrix sp. PCC 11201]|nr:hypothetical protein PL11201_680112 [Planktothrix sp. PCC 11201]
MVLSNGIIFYVSIPERDYWLLQHQEAILEFAINGFQSLKGIIGYCNAIASMNCEFSDVSIPERDYWLLQLLFKIK